MQIGSAIDKLTIYYTNADNLLNKRNELQLIITSKQPDVLVITEIFPKNILSTKISQVELNLEGYYFYGSEVKDNSRGVIIYIRNDIISYPCSEVDDIHFLESAWCVIKVGKNDRLLLGGIYRSSSGTDENNENLLQLLNFVMSLNCKYVMVLGDFNYPEISWDTWNTNRNVNHNSFKFLECLRDNYLYQLIEKPTRVREGQAQNVLDLLITNKDDWVSNIEYLDQLGASDHVQLMIKCDCSLQRTNINVSKRQYYKGNYTKAREDFMLVDWSKLDSLEVQDSFDFICEEIKTCTENNVPVFKKNNYTIKKPKWMDKHCVIAVRKKYKAWQLYLHSRTRRNYHHYCICRNQATKAVRFARKRYEKGVADLVKENPKAFWSYVNSKTRMRSGISDLKDENGTMCSGDADKANILNNFFASVFTKEGDSAIKDITPKTLDSLHEINVGIDKVKKLLQGLNPTKSCGPDECHPRMLKESAESLSVPIHQLFTKSLQSGVLPRQWKEANVTCIFKKGDKSSPGNYRPVSLTSVLCKTLEKVVREAIMTHLNNNNLLSDCQYGFRQNRGCILQLLKVVDEWSKDIDENKQIDCIYLDFRKAFDTVPHKRLLKKLESFGITGTVLKWLEDFLSNRQQRVVVNGTFSNWKPVLSGIPQGSVLGPVLFIIFINDLPDYVKCICKLFADGTKLYKAISCRYDQQLLQVDLFQCCDWSDDWLLLFNILKCKFVQYGLVKFEFNYQMRDSKGNISSLTKDSEEKDLGIIFQENLKFDKQILESVGKANKILGLIKRSFVHLDCDLLLKLFKSMVRPILDYGNVIWFPYTKKNKKLIENIQRRATRMIPELKGLSYTERLQQLKLFSMDYRRKRGDMIQLFKILNGIENIDAQTMFTFATSQTRGHTKKLYKPRCVKGFRQHSFCIRY